MGGSEGVGEGGQPEMGKPFCLDTDCVFSDTNSLDLQDRPRQSLAAVGTTHTH